MATTQYMLTKSKNGLDMGTRIYQSRFQAERALARWTAMPTPNDEKFTGRIQAIRCKFWVITEHIEVNGRKVRVATALARPFQMNRDMVSADISPLPGSIFKVDEVTVRDFNVLVNHIGEEDGSEP